MNKADPGVTITKLGGLVEKAVIYQKPHGVPDVRGLGRGARGTGRYRMAATDLSRRSRLS